MRGAVLVGAALVVAVPAVAHAGPLQFSVTGTVAVGANPQDVVAADVTGDGVLDIVVSRVDGNLVVAQGRGDGSFGPPATVPIAGAGRLGSLAAGDQTGDGLADLAVADEQGAGGKVYRLFGQPGALPALQPAGGLDSDPRAVVIADLDGDGARDVVVGEATNGASTINWNSGTGSFNAAQTLAVGGVADLAVGDATGDGIPDVLTVGPLASWLARGQGPRAFAMPVAAGIFAGTQLAVGDVTGDGALDRVVVADAQAQVSAGAGNGTFAALAPLALPHLQFDVVVADLDGQGPADVAAATWAGVPGGASQVTALQATGGGAFAAPVAVPTRDGPYAIAAGDVDRDGRTDLLSLDAMGETVSVVRNLTVFPAPAVTTGDPAVVGHDSARVTGSVDPRGRQASVRVEYGTTTAYGSATADVPVGSAAGAVGVALDLAGLAPSTTYHYRLVATSPVAETALGDDHAFTTGPAPFALSSARPTLRWKQSRLTGRVVLKGTVTASARLVATLTRKGRTAAVQRRTFTLGKAGAFTRTLHLPRLLRPGAYVLRLVPTVGGAAQPAVQRGLTVPAPREGIVRRAWASALRGTSPLLNLPGTPQQLWAHFEFMTAPRKRPITTTWYRGTSRVAVVARPYAAVIHTFVRSDGPLRPGRWRAVLKAGGTVVAEVRVRVG